MSANAFALPDGSIFTDELIELLKKDEKFCGLCT